MFKTLKWKLTLVYICLVITTAFVGITSVVNIYSLSKSINGLMIDNYKSISSVNYMIEALEEQNNGILTYMNLNSQKGIDLFYKNSDTFYKWYNIESTNVTEAGEQDYVKKINEDYVSYMKMFSQIQEIYKSSNPQEAANFYDSSIQPTFNRLKQELKGLSSLNEKAMFSSKDKVTQDAKSSMYTLLALSAILVIIGSFVSSFSINSILKPIYSLRETIKAVKEGDLDKQSPILSEDEIGDLTLEYNNMIKRLQQYEYSNTGKLMTEKNKFQAIVKSISDPIIILGSNYKILLLNNASENLFDIKEENTRNKYFLEVIRNGELYDYISGIYEGSSEKNESKIIYFAANNKEYYFNVVVTLLKDMENKMDGMIVLFQNITELKQLEKLKADFISTISHEFKTPLTSIMIGTSLISDENIGELNEKQMEIVKTITEDSENLATLVTDLLHLSKIESNKAIFSIEPTSLIGIVENSIRSFTEVANSKDVELVYEIADTLPKVMADSEKVTWVINNLISNALKHTNAGDTILVNAYENKRMLYVYVKDTGIGIPEEYLDKIFNKFIQVKGQDSEFRGTGLGLAIAKEIVEAHGGEIWCESKLDVGSTFTFSLPIA